MLELAKKLEIENETIKNLEKLLLKKEQKVELYANRCKTKGFNCLKGKSYLFVLAVVLNLAVRLKEKYNALGIDEKVYYDTMSDIKIWCSKTGNKGIKNYGWLKNHLSFELFRLGRLQFQLFECKNKTLFYNKLPFDYGERLIYVHIPEGEKLDKEKCIKSLFEAVEFFGKYFPSYEYRFFFCESWLLFEGNRSFMGEKSNIVKFMSLFDIRYSVRIDEQAIERIFGKRRIFKSNYPESTSLQKSAKKYMQNGKRLGVGIGVIDADTYRKQEKQENS